MKNVPSKAPPGCSEMLRNNFHGADTVGGRVLKLQRGNPRKAEMFQIPRNSAAQPIMAEVEAGAQEQPMEFAQARGAPSLGSGAAEGGPGFLASGGVVPRRGFVAIAGTNSAPGRNFVPRPATQNVSEEHGRPNKRNSHEGDLSGTLTVRVSLLPGVLVSRFPKSLEYLAFASRWLPREL